MATARRPRRPSGIRGSLPAALRRGFCDGVRAAGRGPAVLSSPNGPCGLAPLVLEPPGVAGREVPSRREGATIGSPVLRLVVQYPWPDRVRLLPRTGDGPRMDGDRVVAGGSRTSRDGRPPAGEGHTSQDGGGDADGRPSFLSDTRDGQGIRSTTSRRAAPGDFSLPAFPRIRSIAAKVTRRSGQSAIPMWPMRKILPASAPCPPWSKMLYSRSSTLRNSGSP